MKLSDSRRNISAETSGRWIDIQQPDFKGVSLKVRGFRNPDFEAMKAQLLEARPLADRDKDMSDTEFAHLLSATILLGWRGLEDDSGAPIAFDATYAETLLADPEYSDLRTAVIWAAQNVGRDRLASAEQDAKN